MTKTKVLPDKKKSICVNCKWYQGDNACPAYPLGIPKRYSTGAEKHTEKASDQLGIITFIKDFQSL